MIDELEIAYMSWASYTDIIELDTKESRGGIFGLRNGCCSGTKEELIIEFQMSSH